MLKKLIANSRMLFAFGPFLAHGISATCMRKTHFIILLFLLPALLFGLTFCSAHSRYGERLESIDDVISQNPDSAISLLKTIPADSLREGERKFYELLTIKANDKAYVTHESDSLINEVIDYYSRHKGDRRYAEALYYGGRVNSDIGDYPTALRFFEDALDQLPEGAENQRLRSSVLSQTGRLLNKICLYREAEGYLIKAVSIDSLLEDNFRLTYDLQLLGAIRIHLKNYYAAIEALKKARESSKHLSETEQSEIDVYIASALYRSGKTDSALKIIRHLPEKVSYPFLNVTYSLASQIYRDMNIPDTAAFYAYKLIASKNPENRRTGYTVLLSPKLSSIVDVDSLRKLIYNYNRELENDYSERGNLQDIMQTTVMNYSRYKVDAQKARESHKRLRNVFVCILILLIVVVSYLLYSLKCNKSLKNENRSIESKLMHILSRDDKIKDLMNDFSKDFYSRKQERENKSEKFDLQESYTTRRSKLQRELIHRLESDVDLNYHIPEEILVSNIYVKLKDFISNSKIIPTSGLEWKELEIIVNKIYPEFLKEVKLLSQGKISNDLLHTVMLIKLNFSTTDIAVLSGKTMGTISSRKEKLSLMLFDKKLGNQTLTNLIRLL